ncbi:hypothetical protein [Selenomonas sp. AE3005]|uniref:hypothetical protein n=1 Tax=Selenomonas sp. AE3005 TaxID=1485543 RepID=UPI00048489EC|nr:hypothetical protein [Selenomonas sp. AE3005]
MMETNSKMNQVAEIFGKELGNVFEVNVSKPFPTSETVTYKLSFEENGLLDIQSEQFNNELLIDLLTGKANIK